MVLEWSPEDASLLQDRPFSAVASVYISREAWETQNHQTVSSISQLGLGDRRPWCHSHYSTAARALLFRYMRRETRTRNHLTFSYWVRAPRDFMRSECLSNLDTLSAVCSL